MANKEINLKTILVAAVVFVFVILFFSSVFIVSEPEQVIITQFGRPVGNPITEPGVYFKTPFIQTIHKFDKRFLEWDGDPNEIPTKDKRYIWVDTYGRWRIADPLLFFQRVRDERGAQSRLDDVLDGETRNAIAKHDLVEIIRSTNRSPKIPDNLQQDAASLFEKIESGRSEITRAIIDSAQAKVAELGIELLDLRFKRINYVKEVQQKIYERMITERKRVADKYRSEGQGEAFKILGEKERELKKIQSEAYRTAQEIMGKADAEATAIYARAYNKNADSRDFFQFLKTMESYKNTISDKDWLVISTKSEFFKYFKSK